MRFQRLKLRNAAGNLDALHDGVLIEFCRQVIGVNGWDDPANQLILAPDDPCFPGAFAARRR